MDDASSPSSENSSKCPRRVKSLSLPQIHNFLDQYPSGSEEESISDSDEEFLTVPCRDEEVESSDSSEHEDEESMEEEAEVTSDRRKRLWNWVKKDLPVVEAIPSEFIPLLGEVEHTPMTVFKMLLDSELFNLFVLETNKYIIFKGLTNTKHVTFKEIHEFLGILMFMSIMKLPQKRMYWSAEFRIPSIVNVMTQKRFHEIFSILHISDNSTEKKKGELGFDPFHKVRPLINKLNINFQMCAKVESHQSIDEQMVPFKGHHHKKVYMKNKPKKWGYKLWVRAGSISGYMHQFEMAGDLPPYITNIQSNLGESGRVILRLSNSLPKNTHLYFDNYFASPDLFTELNNFELKATCTLQTNRSAKCPLSSDKELKKRGRGSEDHKMDKNSEMLVCKWFDNRTVLLGSNVHSVLPLIPVRRYDRKEKKHITIPCPNIVRNYNKCMGGVDKADMLLSLYRSSLKSIKWYKRLMFHFVDMCIINSWILYRTKYDNVMSVRDLTLIKFKLHLAKSLALSEPDYASRFLGRASAIVPCDFRYDTIGHWPLQNEASTFAQRCKLPNCKSRSTIVCSKCKVSLCIKGVPNCFFTYHNK